MQFFWFAALNLKSNCDRFLDFRAIISCKLNAEIVIPFMLHNRSNCATNSWNCGNSVNKQQLRAEIEEEAEEAEVEDETETEKHTFHLWLVVFTTNAMYAHVFVSLSITHTNAKKRNEKIKKMAICASISTFCCVASHCNNKLYKSMQWK